MAAGIIVTKNFGSLELDQRVVEEELGRALSDVIADIQDATSKGVTFDGRTFKTYSKQYVIDKEATGRSTSPPNLNFTGRMMGSMRARIEKSGNDLIGTIGFPDKDEEQKAVNNNETRPFFGLSTRAQRRLERVEINIK